eukprot:SM000005S17186  [mRNA]  locus=s5:591327:592241:- [translate_table: standard]
MVADAWPAHGTLDGAVGGFVMPAGRRQSAGGRRGHQGLPALPLVWARPHSCPATAALLSQQPTAATYHATHDRTQPPPHQVIATEATNILIRHFYQMAEHKQHRPKRVASETFPAGEQEPKLLRRSSSALPAVGEQPLQEEEGAT